MESTKIPVSRAPILGIGQMTSVSLKKIKKALGNLAYTIKILAYQTDPELVALLDINDDRIFLEPLAFGYFNNPDLNPPVSLTQILYGYISKAKRPSSIGLVFYQNQAYLPNLGTIILSAHHPIAKGRLLYDKEELKVVDDNDRELDFRLQPVIHIEGFELVTNNHPFFHKYFHLLDPETDVSTIDTDKIAGFQADNVKKAMDIIRENCPDFYRIVKLTNYKILLFDCDPINSFAIKDLQGLVFLSSSYSSSVSFYIDDLVHQWSHNILNALLFDISKYFKIDPELASFAPYSTNLNESRNIYDTFHGLFTVAQRTGCFRSIYLKEKELDKNERQELIARFIDQRRRFRNGLQNIPLAEVYTKAGSILYQELDQLADDCLQEISYFIETADFSNQVSRFSYDRFCEKNNLLNVI